MLNKKYLQENFELSRENNELAKSKESHRMLERFFLMLMNSMSQGNLAGNFGQKFSLMPSTMSNRELEPPQPQSVYVEENVDGEIASPLVNQRTVERVPQITVTEIQNNSSRITNEPHPNQYSEMAEGSGLEVRPNRLVHLASEETSQVLEVKDQANGENFRKNDPKNTRNRNRNEQPRGRQLNNEESGVSARSRRSATSRRSKSEPRNYRRDNAANEHIKSYDAREEDVQFDGAEGHLKSSKSSSKDKLIIRRNNGDNISISKVNEFNNSDYNVMKNGTPVNQAGAANNDYLHDEIVSSGRHASSHLNAPRFYNQPRRIYSNRNEIFHHPQVPSHSPSQSHQFQDMLRMMFELMSQ